jgi:hypothetical protein
MFKKAVLLTIICLQFVRLASAMPVIDINDSGTPLSFAVAMAVVNQGLLAQLHPIKTIVKVSSRMADTGSPFQPTRNDTRQHPVETSLIISSAPEFVKTNVPFWPGNSCAMFAAIFMALLLIVARRDGIVLCRIQHLFARAREGICAIMQPSFLFRESPLMRLQHNGDFLFYTSIIIW